MQRSQRFQPSKYRKWVIFVVVFVLISLVIIYNQQNDNVLTLPTGAGVSSSVISEPEEEIKLTFYENETHSYKIGVPDDWTRVVKDGYDTFIHSPSATSVQVQVFDYSPSLLFITKDSISADLTKSGYELSSFSWNSATSFSSVYIKGEEYVYSEITTFDRKKAVRLFFTIEQENVNKITNIIASIIDNFAWEQQDPFPKDTVPVYSEYGSYEFVYPLTWNTGVSNNVYLAQDPLSGAIMSVSANKSTATYESLSNVDYTTYASNGRSSYVLKSFSSNKNMVYAQGTYISNSTQMVLVQYLIATGTYEYTLSFEIPQSNYQELSEVIQEIIRTFRFY